MMAVRSGMADYVDLTHAETVQITISADGTRIWIDSENGNLCRIYNIKQLEVEDRRDKKDNG